MLKSNLAVTWRSLSRHKVASIVNISGMAAGIAAVFLIAIYVQNERSYDRFHKNAERMFRLTVRQKFGNGERIWHQSAWFMGPRLTEEFPFVLDYVRFFRFNRVVEYQDRKIRASGFCVDANVFDVFTFPLVRGDVRTALAKPSSIVMTESLARRLFGDSDPVGKVIKAGEFKGKAYFLTVTGVLKDVPRNSHVSFDYLFSINSVIDRSIHCRRTNPSGGQAESCRRHSRRVMDSAVKEPWNSQSEGRTDSFRQLLWTIFPSVCFVHLHDFHRQSNPFLGRCDVIQDCRRSRG